MKNKTLIYYQIFFTYILFAISLSGCIDKNEIFTGYLVAKEYTPERMSNRSKKTISYAAVIIPPRIVTHRTEPYKINEKWEWFIANKNEIIIKEVSHKMFDTKKCGDKVSIKRW